MAVSESSELSAGQQNALKALYDDPLFAAAPPGAGELLGESFGMACDRDGNAPTGGRTWVLRDSGEAAIAYYIRVGQQGGWETVEQTRPSRDAASDGRRANLVMKKVLPGYTYSFGVSIGRSILHDEVEIGAHGSIVEPPLCQ